MAIEYRCSICKKYFPFTELEIIEGDDVIIDAYCGACHDEIFEKGVINEE